MRTMIVTGAGGFVGREIIREFCGRYSIVAMARSRQSEINRSDIRYVYGDLLELDAHSVLDTLPAGRSDLFVHAAGQAHIARTGDATALFERNNVQAVEAALRLAVTANVGKFVLISSSVVYNDNSGDAYERSKREAEARVIRVCRENGIPYVIVRPVMVYGEREPSGYLASLIRRIESGLVLLPNCGRKAKPLIYIRNLGAFVRQAIDLEAGEGAVLLARDRDCWPLRELYAFVSGHIGRRCLFVPIPTWTVKAANVGIHLLQKSGFLHRIQVRSLRNLNRDVQYPTDEQNEYMISGLPYSTTQGLRAALTSLRTGGPIAEDDDLQDEQEHDHGGQGRFDEAEPERGLPKQQRLDR